jgi:hypothetical protein
MPCLIVEFVNGALASLSLLTAPYVSASLNTGVTADIGNVTTSEYNVRLPTPGRSVCFPPP